MFVRACVRVRARVPARVRARVRVCVCACVFVAVRLFVLSICLVQMNNQDLGPRALRAQRAELLLSSIAKEHAGGCQAQS